MSYSTDPPAMLFLITTSAQSIVAGEEAANLEETAASCGEHRPFGSRGPMHHIFVIGYLVGG